MAILLESLFLGQFIIYRSILLIIHPGISDRINTIQLFRFVGTKLLYDPQDVLQHLLQSQIFQLRLTGIKAVFRFRNIRMEN